MSSTTKEVRMQDAPLGEILAGTAAGLSNAQKEMDDAWLDDAMAKQAGSAPSSFYRFSDVSVDLKLSLSMMKGAEDGSPVICAAPVDADYCNEYQYDPAGASRVMAKLVHADAMDVFEEKIKEKTGEKVGIIMDYAAANDASGLTIEQLEMASGMDDLNGDDLDEYKTAVANSAPEEIGDMSALKKLLESINAKIKLRRYNLSGDADVLTAEELETAGLENIAEINLPAYKEVVARTLRSVLALDTFMGELQKLVNETNADVIINKNESCMGEDAAELSLEQLAVAGLDNLVENNLDAYRQAVSNTSFSTVDDVQRIMDRVNLGVIRDCSLKGDAGDISPELLKATGLKNFVDDHFEAYGDMLAKAVTLETLSLQGSVKAAVKAYRDVVVTSGFYKNAGADVAAPGELQVLIDTVNMEVVRGYGALSDAETLTLDHLEAMGVETAGSGGEELVGANIEAYKRAVAADGASCNELSHVQALIKRENILGRIRNLRLTGDVAEIDGTDFAGMGLYHIRDENIDACRKGILEAGAGFPADIEAMQGLIDRTNAESGTLEQLTATGTDNVVSADFDSYKEAFAGASAGNSRALQALVDMENSLAQIRDYCLSGNAGQLTIKQLLETGADSVEPGNLELYRQAVASADSISDFSRLRGVVDYVNAIVANSLTATVISAVGVKDAIDSNLEEYKKARLSADLSGLQKSVYQANLAKIQSYAGKNASELAMEHFAATGARRLKEENLADYRRIIKLLSAPFKTLEEMQELIDRENALAVILSEHRRKGNAGNLSLSLLQAAHVKNVEASNFAAYRKAISDSVTLKNSAQLQALINRVNGQR